MLRRLPRRVLWILVLASAAGVFGVRLAAFWEPECVERPSAGASSSVRPHPLSCKPSPPVVATLVPNGDRGTWRVRIEALEPVSQVEVSVGARADEQDLAPVVVWRGALAQGESRDLDVRYAPPAGAREVWVDAGVALSGAIQRSRAALPLRDGRAVPQLAAIPEAGRVVLDPVSGQRVVEFVGTPGGSR